MVVWASGKCVTVTSGM